ncbi:hypothetical protein OUZ56_009996 [Daphnia magna]|uniref:Secreted protein n=1 Tax=Daphnia magna TaxID=35525 RepID=A0ABR0AHH6_9CRUS|nr:hypothetical protein OUZ56_009996 [Daphnia magna]
MMGCPVSVMVGVPCVSVLIAVPCVSVMISVPCVNTICFIYSCAVISTPALVRGDSQAARKVGSSSSARSLTKESTGRLLGNNGGLYRKDDVYRSTWLSITSHKK